MVNLRERRAAAQPADQEAKVQDADDVRQIVKSDTRAPQLSAGTEDIDRVLLRKLYFQYKTYERNFQTSGRAGLPATFMGCFDEAQQLAVWSVYMPEIDEIDRTDDEFIDGLKKYLENTDPETEPTLKELKDKFSKVVMDENESDLGERMFKYLTRFILQEIRSGMQEYRRQQTNWHNT